jgi:hypothetical protein
MNLATVRVLGHGITGPQRTATAGTIVSGTDRRAFTADFATNPTELVLWAAVWIESFTGVPNQRAFVTARLSLGGTAWRVTFRVDTGIPIGAGSPFGGGFVYLDDVYTYADRIPAECLSSAWREQLAAPIGGTIGAKFDIGGGLSTADGLTFALARTTGQTGDTLAPLLSHVLTNHIDAAGDAIVLGRMESATTVASLRTATRLGSDYVDALPAGVTYPQTATIDGECVSMLSTTSAGVQARRGALGTLARAHITGSPLYYQGTWAGREIEVWTYDDPAHPWDTVTRWRGVLNEPPRIDRNLSQIVCSASTDAFRPRAIIPSADVLTTAEFDVGQDPDGTYYWAVNVAQADPESVWSWMRFGSILVRVKRDESAPVATPLGYSLVRYRLPSGRHSQCFTTADPMISRKDAINLLGVGDPRTAAQFIAREGRGPGLEIYNSDIEVARREIYESGETWFRANGLIQNGTLYRSAPPEPCHLFEIQGAHATALALDVWDFNGTDFEAESTELYFPRVESLEIAQQVIESVNGAGGGRNLLPAELSLASRAPVTSSVRTEPPALTSVVLTGSSQSDLAKWLTEEVLERSYCSIAQGIDGGWRLVYPLGQFEPTNTTIEITTDDLLIGGGNTVSMVADYDTGFREAVCRITDLSSAHLTEPGNPRTQSRRYAPAGNFGASGDVFGGVIQRSRVSEYIEASLSFLDSYSNLAVSLFSRPLWRLKFRSHVGFTPDVGDFVSVTLPVVPDAIGLDAGFEGVGYIVARTTDRQANTSDIECLLIANPSQGVRLWSAVANVSAVTSDTVFAVTLAPYTTEITSAVSPFAAGDVLWLLDQYGTRRDDTGATIATAALATDRLTGTLTLSAAFKVGGVDVTPAIGDIVIHAPRPSQTVRNIQLKYAWQDSTLALPTRWL